MEYLKVHQLNIMLFLSGICLILAILTMMTRSLTPKRRRVLASLEFAAMVLLISDRYAYIYRGDLSRLGYWMVRISNFLVYFMTLYIMHVITLYLFDLFRNEGKLSVIPKRLWICEILFAIGEILVMVSQFTGLYYSFDAQNTYRRAPANIICYVMPIVITLLQMSVIIQYRQRLSRVIVFSLLLNTIVPLIASIIQIFTYGVSLTNMTVVGMAILLYVFALADLNQAVERAQRREIEFYKEEQKRERALFEQTTEALTSAIDAKDEYTHGHSGRVALYSQQIARAAGMSEEECDKVYFAGLLHDVGKIGINDSIINKDGRLTDEEFAQIKRHPVYGNQILSRIQQSPYLSIAAHYHHERYDGKGYPDGLKGEDIPELARIIAVADSYDAMTSKRSYRDPLPQEKAREELVKGVGAQFDPKFAKIMLHLIDMDVEYRLKEQDEGYDPSIQTRLHCESVYHDCTTGILITDQITRIRLFCKPDEGFTAEEGIPSLIVFDALDGRIHETEAKQKDLLYHEYGQLRFDGRAVFAGVRKMESKVLSEVSELTEDEETAQLGTVTRYNVEAVRYEDHLMIRIGGRGQNREIVVALPDSSRFTYLSLTGEHCVIRNIHIEQDETAVGPDYIPRIAEEISYIRDCPEGDIPNLQINRWRSAATQGIPIAGDMKLSFHAQSLPTSRLIWHCPFISVFTSKDGKVNGDGFREFVLIRLDGENWESDDHAKNEMTISQTTDFRGWNEWKDRFRQGLDCVVSIRREDNRITAYTENLGVVIRCDTTVYDGTEDIYAALTGDQCAITDIHVESQDSRKG